MKIFTTTWVVLDIEGTTSSTESVHVGLYSYARPRLGPWIDAHPDDPLVAQARAESGLPASAATPDIVAVLHGWMDGDVKATPLKTLQGLIWADGFAAGDLVSHFFPDVPPALRSWRAAGLRLAVFSSGSVASQRPWFRHGPDGDLTGLVDHFFDTVSAGPKRVEASYARIAETLGGPALFLSDVPAELHAAAAAGWATVGVARRGEPHGDEDFGPHPTVASFDDLRLLPLPKALR
jgi:enolase-phosphatase E1